MSSFEERCRDREFRERMKFGKHLCYQCRREFVENEGDTCWKCDMLIDEEVAEIIRHLERQRKKSRCGG